MEFPEEFFPQIFENVAGESPTIFKMKHHRIEKKNLFEDWKINDSFRNLHFQRRFDNR